MYINTLFETVTPKTRKEYARGTSLLNWYRMLKTRGIGPDGRTLSPNLLKSRSAPNSNIVDIKVDTTEKD